MLRMLKTRKWRLLPRIHHKIAITRDWRNYAIRKKIPFGISGFFSTSKVLSGGVLLISTALGYFGINHNAEAAERKFTYAEARDEISSRLQEFRSTNKSAKWPKLRIRQSSSSSEPSDDNLRYQNQPRYIFEFQMQPDVKIEELLERILQDVAEQPLQIQTGSNIPTTISPSNAAPASFLYLSSLDGTFNIIMEKSSCKLYFEKLGNTLSVEEIDTIVNCYKISNQHTAKANEELAELGLRVYRASQGDDSFGWDNMAGYESIKQEIQATVVHALKHPEIYAEIVSQTRQKQESNQPKAILFEGPPGTGKTTVARIIAAEIDVPMVYVPVESIMSMYYGESEKLLSKVFDTCEKIGKSIIFIDEIDSLATSRGPNMHEATRRILSTLLRRIEGFEEKSGVIVIGATNRKSDLDEAMLSRFDISIKFSLPDVGERADIFKLYAKQLPAKQLELLAQGSQGLSGRDIRDLCAHAERNWGTILIEKMESRKNNSESWSGYFPSQVPKDSKPLPTPPLSQYQQSLKLRRESMRIEASNGTSSLHVA
mmetsp:Transcript_5908/g.8122  ORF Transcript_5908/g.8122 Transcript_5908/m.8122 type:complete len:542 (+) Transcript_5908:42-1667(+)